MRDNSKTHGEGGLSLDSSGPDVDPTTAEIHRREDAFDSRALHAHVFVAIDPSLYAGRDRSLCAFCGESTGHHSHRNGFGLMHTAASLKGC